MLPVYTVNLAYFLFDSFVTPPLHADIDRTPRSARRSLDFDRPRPSCDPVPLTSSPLRLSNHSCPDMSSYAEVPASPQQWQRVCVENNVVPSRQSVGSTTVKELLTPIAERLQSSPAVTPPAHSDNLDRTLTDADCCSQLYNAATNEAGRPAACTAIDESCHSRWSASDYFRRYPDARLDCTNNTPCCRSPCSESAARRCTAADRQTGTADDASTLISSIHRNGSPARGNLSPCSVPSVEGSVESSSSVDSISTADDAAFRAGLARLDANIALIQQRLRGTLSSPTAVCRSPRANSSPMPARRSPHGKSDHRS